MGLDLYAGTLTRYYSGQWLTTVQRAMQGSGAEVKVVYSSGAAPWLKPEKSAVAVKTFARELSERWGAKFPYFASPPTWSESEDAPYLTEKPDHDGVRSLVVLAAYLERPELTRPTELPGDLAKDPAYSQAWDRGYYMGPMVVFEAQMFLPGTANFVIVARDPLGVDRYITSVGMLRDMLVQVNERAWKAGPEIRHSWRRQGLVPWGPVHKVWVGPQGPGGKLREEPNLVADKLEHNAQFAMACFWDLCDFAEKHNVPIVVDQ